MTVRAGVGQRAALDPAIKDTRTGEELGKKDQLSIGCGLSRLVPLHVDATTHGAHHHRLRDSRNRHFLHVFALTHLVNTPI